MRYERFSALLNGYLNRQDRSSAWLAQRLSIHRSTVSRWLNGETRPDSPENVRALADALHIREAAERQELLVAASYGYVETASPPPPSPSLPAPYATKPELPWDAGQRFIGRADDVYQIVEHLSHANRTPVVAITGLGGIGKTAVACQVVRQVQQQDRFDAIVWTSAKSEHFAHGAVVESGRADFGFDDLLSRIGRQCGRLDIPQMPAAQRREAVSELLQGQRVLVVIDNLETMQEGAQMVDALYRMLGRSKLLLTSRHHIEHERVFAFPLRRLPEQEAMTFVREEGRARNVEAINQAGDRQVATIAQATGGAPLAMKLVVGQMALEPMHAVLSALQRPTAAGQDYTFYRFLYWRSWQLLTEAARLLWVEVSVFPTSEGFNSSEGVEPEDVEAITSFPSEALWPTMAELVKLSLVDKLGRAQEERFVLHPLSRYFIQADITHAWAADFDQP